MFLKCRLGLPFSNHMSKAACRERNSLSCNGPQTDIGLCLPGWKAYEVSGVGIFVRLSICSKPSQPLPGKEFVSSEWVKCSLGSVSLGELSIQSLRMPT